VAEPDTAARLTATGQGAIAVVRAAGPHAIAKLSPHFHPHGKQPLIDLAIDRIAIGRWGGEAGEEIVVCRTAADTVELHCHGGPVVVEMLLATLEELGFHIERSSSHQIEGHSDPLRTEAEAALTLATTERTAGILLDQYHGALRDAAVSIFRLVQSAEPQRALDEVDRLLARWSVGKHLVEPFTVVLTGAVNAGKSTLLNALVGFDRMVVDATPGTTRDAVRVNTAFDGWPVVLVDTAGLRDSDDAIEMEGIRRARVEREAANLAIVVVDGTQAGGSDENESPIGVPHLVVYNKADLMPPRATGRREGICVSALRGMNIETLMRRIADILVPNAPLDGTAVPFTNRQYQILEGIHAALTARNRDLAFGLLSALLGGRM
jgi:tRNA modification GTPase